MTSTSDSTPSFGGHFFVGTPVFFNEDAGGGGGGEPVVTAPEGGEPVVPAGGEPITPVVEGEPVVTPASTEPVVEPGDDTIPETLRPYIKQLRDEAADRRVALKPYEDVFGQLDPEESTALLSVIGGLVNEETAYEAAQQLKAVVESILGDGTEDPDRPLTRADLERIRKEEEAQAQQEQAVQAVLHEAAELGYPDGTREQRRLLDLAVNETAGDLKAAHAAIQAERDAIIADYAKQVMEGKAKWPTIAPATGGTPSDTTGEPPKSWAEARKASEARRKAAYGG